MTDEEAVALIKDNGGEATPEVDEAKAEETEVKTEEVEETESTEEVEEPEVKEETPDLKSQAKIQARFDELTARVREAERRAAEAETKAKSADTGEKVYSLEELRAIKSNPEMSQYHSWADEKMVDLKVEQKLHEFSQTSETRQAHMESIRKAVGKFPEIADKNSPLWRRANEIFIERGYIKNNPDGEYLAALEANAELSENSLMGAAVTKKKLDKEVAKKGLAGSSRKPAVESASGKISKLLAEAKSSGKEEDWQKVILARASE